MAAMATREVGNKPRWARWPRLAVLGLALALTTHPAAGPERPPDECPRPAGSAYAVKALRFNDGRSYAFVVTNNGPKPIRSISIGWGGPPYIEGSVKTEPASMGSPSGWKGRHLDQPDPRLPKSHSPTLVRYYWTAEEDAMLIEPGRSLSGFSVQLPTPHEMELAWLRSMRLQGVSVGTSDLPTDPPINDRLPPQPDLTRVSFEVWDDRRWCGSAVGTVVPDWAANVDAQDVSQPHQKKADE